MRDAIGGSVTIVIIVVFIVFALGYMAFNVNYTKAFRMKDKIITVYDDYNGNCNTACENEIKEYADKIGYSSGTGTGGTMYCPTGTSKLNLYCVDEVPVTTGDDDNISDSLNARYYHISTKISMEIPAFKNILNFRIFYVFGTTQTYK